MTVVAVPILIFIAPSVYSLQSRKRVAVAVGGMGEGRWGGERRGERRILHAVNITNLGERLVRRSELFQRKEYTDACPWKKRGIVGIRDFFAACRAGTFDPAAPGVTDKRLNESADAEPDILISRCGFGEPAAISREEALCVPFSFSFLFLFFRRATHTCNE